MNQQWQIVPDGAGCYNIVSKGGSTFKLGYTVDREVPKIKTANTDNQKWKLHDTYDGYYRISAKADDLEFIDLNDGDAFDGGVVQIWKSGTNSKWKFVEVTGGNETRITSGALDFYIEKTEVPQAEFEVIMNLNNSASKEDLKPITNVTMWDAILYCNARSIKEGLEPVYIYTEDPVKNGAGNCTSLPGFVEEIDFTKNGYRLPTEDEWRAAYYNNSGRTTVYFWGTSTDNAIVSQYAFYGDPSGSTHRVGQLSPNPAGLYDMAGNVSELVWSLDGPTRLKLYGGSYSHAVTQLTGDPNRDWDRSQSTAYIGFRMVRTAR